MLCPCPPRKAKETTIATLLVNNNNTCEKNEKKKNGVHMYVGSSRWKAIATGMYFYVDLPLRKKHAPRTTGFMGLLSVQRASAMTSQSARLITKHKTPNAQDRFCGLLSVQRTSVISAVSVHTNSIRQGIKIPTRYYIIYILHLCIVFLQVVSVVGMYPRW